MQDYESCGSILLLDKPTWFSPTRLLMLQMDAHLNIFASSCVSLIKSSTEMLSLYFDYTTGWHFIHWIIILYLQIQLKTNSSFCSLSLDTQRWKETIIVIKPSWLLEQQKSQNPYSPKGSKTLTLASTMKGLKWTKNTTRVKESLKLLWNEV